MTDVRITFLGGLGEIGRNCAAFEHDGRIVLLDCGLMFPDVDMLGVDLVLPDFTWLRERADRIEGVILTHGHEDHVGSLPYLLREVEVPLYGSALTLGLARGRIEEAGLLQRTELIAVADGERRDIGPFECEFLPVTHSVPHGFATAFHTAQGTILHSGDFKLDLTPVDGRLTDLATHRRRCRRGTASACCCRTRPTPRSTVTPASEQLRRRGALRPHARERGPPDHHGLLRQPHPPHPADRRRAPRPSAARSRRSVDRCAATSAWPARWARSTSPSSVLIDIDDIDRYEPGTGLRGVDRVAG